MIIKIILLLYPIIITNKSYKMAVHATFYSFAKPLSLIAKCYAAKDIKNILM